MNIVTLISKKLSLKILKIKKGKKGGLQYHRKKNECGILIKGLLKLITQIMEKKIKTKILKKGMFFIFHLGLYIKSML